jgi:hypothetical protein
VDRIERRFGRGATTHASLLDRSKARVGPGFRRSDGPPYNR